MRKLNVIFGIQLFFTILATSLYSYGQIIINSGPEVSPIDMVENILGEGIIYSNVTFQGADVSRGIFSNGDSTNLGLESGVFLTSGAGYIIPGPNYSTSAGVNNGLGGHPTLNNISPSTTYDACVLEFDIIPDSDTLKLTYVFGSEEYNEWVGVTYNDVFGLFVTGPNPMGGFYNDKNIALIPGTNIPVSINTVNNNSFPEYYIDNTNGLTIEYDGFTTVLLAWLLVNPCEEYHLKLGVADAGDHIYDSGILIAENSITCPKIEVEAQLNPPGIINRMVENFVDADIIFKLPHLDYSPLTVYFEVGGTADPQAYPPGDFEEEIPTEVSFNVGEDSTSFNVKPVYDGIIEGEETLQLIVENTLGCIDRYDTVVFTILDYVEMYAQTSPNTMICLGQEVDLWVDIIYGGFPPYTYFWEPGGYTTDSITVIPEENTTYIVTITDLFEETAQDSVQVILFPVCDLETFYFEVYLNTGLPYDVYGEVMDDTVLVVFPPGTNLNALIPSYTFDNEDCTDSVGATNDFTNPVVYEFIGPGGCLSHWVIISAIETGEFENIKNSINIFPNPANNRISISNAQGNNLTVLNSQGEVILKKRIKENKVNLSVDDLVKGIYYFQFRNNTGWFVEKVVINQ